MYLLWILLVNYSVLILFLFLQTQRVLVLGYALEDLDISNDSSLEKSFFQALIGYHRDQEIDGKDKHVNEKGSDLKDHPLLTVA